MSNTAIVETSIHRRVVLAADGTRQERVFVRCPRGNTWEPLARCKSCASCSHLSTPDRVDDWLLLCKAPGANDARTGEVAACAAAVTSAMEASVLCVAHDVAIVDVARAMRAADAEVALVVDSDGRPIGVVTPIDLVDTCAATAGEAMTPYVTALLEDAPIARALDLATERELSHIPILSSGRVMGVVSPRSLLEWITKAQ